MPLPPPRKSKRALDLPLPPGLSPEETTEQEFRAFMGEQEQYEAEFFVKMNKHAEELKELGLDQPTLKVALSSIASDLESSLGKPMVPDHLQERFDEREAKLREPYRKKIERLADEQIRKDQNQRDLEGLADLHERGALKGHPLEPMINRLFLDDKEKENGNEQEQ